MEGGMPLPFTGGLRMDSHHFCTHPIGLLQGRLRNASFLWGHSVLC